MTTVVIEPATLADAAGIAAVYAHHVLHGSATFEVVPPTAMDIERRMSAGTEGGWPWLLARDADGGVAGYAYAGPFHPRPAYRFTCEDSIYLRHDRRGEGIGTALLGALLPACEGIGMRQMIALIAGGEAASLALHARFGFVEVGRLADVGRKQGRWLDVVQMQRALGQGASTPPVAEPG